MKLGLVWITNAVLGILLCLSAYGYKKMVEKSDMTLSFMVKEAYMDGYKDGHTIGSMQGWKDGAVMRVLEKQEKDK